MQTDGGAGPNGKMSARNIGLQFLTRGLHQSMWLRGPPLPPSHSIRSVTAVLVGSWVGSDADSEGRVRVCVPNETRTQSTAAVASLLASNFLQQVSVWIAMGTCECIQIPSNTHTF